MSFTSPLFAYNYRMVTPGYSATPLAKKLGLKSTLKLLTVHAPKEYASWLGELPEGVKLVTDAKPPIEAVHMFVTESAFLDATLSRLRKELKQDGFVWVSWPKKSSRVATDITEDTIREIALPLGFVDVKVCAVSEVWSGLKLVIRKWREGSDLDWGIEALSLLRICKINSSSRRLNSLR